MNRDMHGLRQHQHAERHFSWLEISTKKLAAASVVAVLAVNGGIALIHSTDSMPNPSKPQTVAPSSSTTSSHPLLGLDDASTPLPGLNESPAQQQTNSRTNTSNSADDITNRFMHQTTVTINGESIEIPPSGSSRQTIKNQDGTQTQVDIQHDQTQTDSTTRSNIIIDSSTRSSNSSASLNNRITITH